MELVIETGVVTYSLNGKVDISFNPTDVTFVEKLFDAFSDLEAKQAAYQEEAAKMDDKRAVFRLMRERDAEMRNTIDTVLGADVCGPLFGDINVYAMANGLPLWANLILSIIETIDTSFAREQKAVNPKLQRYLDKYHAKG